MHADRTPAEVHQLFTEHNEALVAKIRARGYSDDVAQEAAQFAWMQLIQWKPDRGSEAGWLYVVAKNQAYAIVTRADREQPMESLPEDRAVQSDDPAELAERAEVADALNTAFAQDLTDNQRAALTLWAQGVPYREIAERLGKRYTWVNRHVTEGLERLRKAFGREGGR